MSKKNSDPKPGKSDETKNEESEKTETPKDEKSKDENLKNEKSKDKKSKDEKSKEEKPKEEKPTNAAKFRPIPFVLSIILIIYEIASILLFLAISFNKYRSNKKYPSNSEYTDIDIFLLACHFIFHIIVIIYIVLLLVFAYKDASNNSLSGTYFITIIASLITIIFWAAYFGIFVVTTKINPHEIAYDDLKELVNTTSPEDFIFIYSKDKIKVRDCKPNPMTGIPMCSETYSKCYSKTGIKIPLKSELIGEPYHFLKDTPKYFHFKIDQVMNFSDEFQKQFNRTMLKIKRCSSEKLRTKFFPIVNKTYVVLNPVRPPYVTHKTRLMAAYLGAGVDFDMYVKSIPFFTYEQRIKIDVDPDVNYTKIWTGRSCKRFGKCDPDNIKPHPADDEL